MDRPQSKEPMPNDGADRLDSGKPEFKHEVYETDCGMWFHHKPMHLVLTDEAYTRLEDNGFQGTFDLKEGVDYIEAVQPVTIDSIEGNEDEACRCGSTRWLYCDEGWAVLCKECWDNA